MMEESERETSSWKYLLTQAVKSKKEEQGLIKDFKRNGKNNQINSGKRFKLAIKKPKSTKMKCPNCDTMFYPKTLLVHKRYFCNKEPPKNLEFKLVNNHLALCFKCKRPQHHDSIILHSKYTCKNNYIRCFYCPAVFKGHMSKRSPLMSHIKYVHSKGSYEVNDLVSKLSPEDFHEDMNGVVYTSFQSSEVDKQVEDSAGCHENEIEENFDEVLIKQEVEEAEDIFKKSKIPDPIDNFVIKQEANEANTSDMSNDSQINLHNEYAINSVSKMSENKDSICPEHKMEAKDEVLSHCTKCSKLICTSAKRLHKKYFCGKTPDDRLGWKIDEASPVSAVCLKCGKNRLKPHLIEFHVAYICGKIPMSVQCFYCDEFFNNYTRLLIHMKNIHKRKHERLDLLSVLPPAEDASSENTVTEGCQSKIVKVYFGGFKNVLQNWNGPAVYECFYCNESFAYVFESLDHMEEEHYMKHSTYDVLRNHLGSF